MHRILDLKPGHEAVVVERIYSTLARAIVKERPQLKAEFSLTEDIFGQDEKTLITENPALKEELAAGHSEPSDRRGQFFDPGPDVASSDPEDQFSPTEQETKLLRVGRWSPLTSVLLGLVVISLVILLWLLIVP